MTRDRCRPFGLLDVMILVGFVAIGLASPRAAFPDLRWSDVSGAVARAASTNPIELIGFAIEAWVVLGGPLVASLAIAVVAIRLRGPRPPLGRALRSPGVLACVWIPLGLLSAAMFVVVVAVLVGPPLGAIIPMPVDRGEGTVMALVAGQLISAFGILACWGTMALHRRRFAIRCWIDRLGLVIAATWIATSPLAGLYFLAFGV